MAFTLKIDTDNAAFYDDSDGDAFDPGPELARIFRELADQVEEGDLYAEGAVRDVNGNTVGRWTLSKENEA